MIRATVNCSAIHANCCIVIHQRIVNSRWKRIDMLFFNFDSAWISEQNIYNVRQCISVTVWKARRSWLSSQSTKVHLLDEHDSHSTHFISLLLRDSNRFLRSDHKESRRFTCTQAYTVDWPTLPSLSIFIKIVLHSVPSSVICAQFLPTASYIGFGFIFILIFLSFFSFPFPFLFFFFWRSIKLYHDILLNFST